MEYKAFQEITAIKFVKGKDENGNDLDLTRAVWHRYDKADNGDIGPDHNTEGSTLFVGSIQGDLLVKKLAEDNEPEWNITTFIADGVEAVTA